MNEKGYVTSLSLAEKANRSVGRARNLSTNFFKISTNFFKKGKIKRVEKAKSKFWR